MYTYIDSLDDLAYLNKEFLLKPYLGVDTEFRRTTKDNMRLALIQVNDDEETYLIDSIIIEDPCEHVSFLFSDSVIKIFHSCKEDLEAVFSWTHKKMINIFDTQIANSFLGGDFTIGYQSLVQQELGIILNKSETRSNWIRRPLSDSQLKYAALDVEYLIHLYKHQRDLLACMGKLEWHNQDIKQLLKATFDPLSGFSHVERTIAKAQEKEILFQFNKVVEEISEREEINKTLFFSKKYQKDFLRLVLTQGLDLACQEITPWRRELIQEEIYKILR